jgi:hypothetical protein
MVLEHLRDWRASAMRRMPQAASPPTARHASIDR